MNTPDRQALVQEIVAGGRTLRNEIEEPHRLPELPADHARRVAERFETLTHSEVLARGLKVADATAISLCRDNDLPIIVFNLLVEGNIARAVRGERIGTLVVS